MSQSALCHAYAAKLAETKAELGPYCTSAIGYLTTAICSQSPERHLTRRINPGAARAHHTASARSRDPETRGARSRAARRRLVRNARREPRSEKIVRHAREETRHALRRLPSGQRKEHHKDAGRPCARSKRWWRFRRPGPKKPHKRRRPTTTKTAEEPNVPAEATIHAVLRKGNPP
jgi:hypothetical protein